MIALGNMLVDVGMLAGSILAMVLAVGGFWHGTFSGPPRCWRRQRCGHLAGVPVPSCGFS